MSNSALICYTKLSPNHSGNRTHAIDTISIHCMAGNLSVESCGALFANSSRQASSNYGIGSDGRIALYVPEAYRSWCTSSRANDQRAITIEVANNGGAPDWPVSDKAYQALLNLVEDICQRNSIKKLVWSTVKNNRVNHVGGCNMTVHRDYAAKACPGDYLYDRHGSIAAEINKRLGGGSSTPSTPTTGSEQTATNYTVKVTATDLNIRSGPGTNYGRKGFIAPGVYTIVAEADGTGATKWGQAQIRRRLDFPRLRHQDRHRGHGGPGHQGRQQGHHRRRSRLRRPRHYQRKGGSLWCVRPEPQVHRQAARHTQRRGGGPLAGNRFLGRPQVP